MGWIILILILFGAGLISYMFMLAFSNRVVHHELFFSDFPNTFGEFRIFFISDIHRRRIADKIIDAVKDKADIVIIGGDLTEKGVPIERTKNNLTKLNQIAPIFFVLGNNDYEADRKEFISALLDSKVQILENTAVTFESEEGEKMSVLGIGDVNQHLDRLDLAVKDCPQGSFKILACHYPSIKAKIKSEDEIRLVMSGHTHGGQIHILGYSPYHRGRLEKLTNTTLLISNGYGTTKLPLRLGAPPESHLITIKNG